MTFFYIFSLKNLVISKKSSNFAPAFGKEASKKDANFIVSLAQLVEQLTLNQWVESSSLSGDTKKRSRNASLFFHNDGYSSKGIATPPKELGENFSGNIQYQPKWPIFYWIMAQFI